MLAWRSFTMPRLLLRILLVCLLLIGTVHISDGKATTLSSFHAIVTSSRNLRQDTSQHNTTTTHAGQQEGIGAFATTRLLINQVIKIVTRQRDILYQSDDARTTQSPEKNSNAMMRSPSTYGMPYLEVRGGNWSGWFIKRKLSTRHGYLLPAAASESSTLLFLHANQGNRGTSSSMV